jgi:hypothetical protein
MMSTVTLPPTTPHQLAWMLAAPALLAWPALPSGAAASPIFQSQHLLRAEIDGGRRRSPRLAPWRELEGSPHRRSARPKDSRARAPREHEGGRVDRAVLRGLGAAPRAGLVGAVLRAVPAREPPVSRQDRAQPADASTDPLTAELPCRTRWSCRPPISRSPPTRSSFAGSRRRASSTPIQALARRTTTLISPATTSSPTSSTRLRGWCATARSTSCRRYRAAGAARVHRGRRALGGNRVQAGGDRDRGHRQQHDHREDFTGRKPVTV